MFSNITLLELPLSDSNTAPAFSITLGDSEQEVWKSVTGS